MEINGILMKAASLAEKAEELNDAVQSSRATNTTKFEHLLEIVTASNELWREVNQTFEKLREDIKRKLDTDIQDGIDVTIMVNTLATKGGRHWLCINTHYITKHFKIKSYMLKLRCLEDQYDSDHVRNEIFESLEWWSLNKRKSLFMITNDKAKIERGFLECKNYSWVTVPCLASLLRILATTEMQQYQEYMNLREKCKAIVEILFQRVLSENVILSPFRCEIHKNKVELELLHKASADWESTFSALETFFNLRTSLTYVVSKEWCLSDGEWELLEAFVTAFTPVRDAIALINEKCSPVLSLYIPMYEALKNALAAHMSQNGLVASISHSLSSRLQASFEAALKNEVLLLATLLDPRFKNRFIPVGWQNTVIKTLKLRLETISSAAGDPAANFGEHSLSVKDAQNCMLMQFFHKKQRGWREVSDALSFHPIDTEIKLYLLEDTVSIEVDSAYVVFNEKGSIGKLCTENLNATLPSTEMETVLQTAASSLCSLLTYSGVQSVEVRIDDEEDVQYVHMEDPSASEITFVRAPCPSKEVMYVRCSELECGVQPLRQKRSNRGLSKMAEPGDWPWHVALFKEEVHVCDATLVAENWLVATASCFQGQPKAEWSARLGTVRLSSTSPWQQERRIVGMIKSPVEGSTTVLLKLDRPVTTFSDFVRPVCLPSNQDPPFNASHCNTLGWARNRDMLQRVQLRHSAMEKCENISIASVNSVCTEPAYSTDDCNEEEVAGSPMLCLQADGQRWALMGVGSWRIACSKAGVERPRLYDKISSNIAWIRSTID